MIRAGHQLNIDLLDWPRLPPGLKLSASKRQNNKLSKQVNPLILRNLRLTVYGASKSCKSCGIHALVLSGLKIRFYPSEGRSAHGKHALLTELKCISILCVLSSIYVFPFSPSQLGYNVRFQYLPWMRTASFCSLKEFCVEKKTKQPIARDQWRHLQLSEPNFT